MVRSLIYLGLFCLLWLACTENPRKQPSENIVVTRWVFGPGISEFEALLDLHNSEVPQRLLSEAINQSPYFVDSTKSGEGWKTVIQLDWLALRPSESSGLLLEWSMQTPTSIRHDFPDPMLNISVWIQVDASADSMQFMRALKRALAQTMVVLDAHFDLAWQGLIHRNLAAKRLFASENGDLILLALNWVAVKQVRNLASEVIELVNHQNPDVAIAAIETLGSIGDSAHVPEIIEHLRLGDLGHAIRGYEAIGQLCGPQARAFLEFAVRNEDSTEGRNAAVRALENCKSGPIANMGQLREPLRGHRP